MAATDYKGIVLTEDTSMAMVKIKRGGTRSFQNGGTWNTQRLVRIHGVKHLSQDSETLDYMAKSGNFGMLIGIESTNEAVLEKMNKRCKSEIGHR